MIRLRDFSNYVSANILRMIDALWPAQLSPGITGLVVFGPMSRWRQVLAPRCLIKDPTKTLKKLILAVAAVDDEGIRWDRFDEAEKQNYIL